MRLQKEELKYGCCKVSEGYRCPLLINEIIKKEELKYGLHLEVQGLLLTNEITKLIKVWLMFVFIVIASMFVKLPMDTLATVHYLAILSCLDLHSL